MSSCIYCGKDVPQGELFCNACRRMVEENPQMPEKTSEPMRTHKAAPSVAAQTTAQRQTHRSLPRWASVLIVLLAIVAAGTSALLLAQLWNARTQRVELRVREEALAAQEKEFQNAKEELETTKAALSEAELTVHAQKEQIQVLQTELSTAQSSANQSQYDMKTQQEELDRLKTENQTLSEQVEALQESEKTLQEEKETLTQEQETLQKENETLRKEQTALKEKSDFVDSFVVFVENDRSGLYHKYGCEAFSRKSFWAYSTKLAESYGFHACPKCFG